MSTNPIDKVVGRNVQSDRKKSGDNVASLAKETSLCENDWLEIERGNVRASASQLFEITTVLGISVRELFEFDELILAAE